MIKRNLILIAACLATLGACTKEEVKVTPEPKVVEEPKIVTKEVKEVYTEKDQEPAATSEPKDVNPTYDLGEKLPVIQRNAKADKALATKRKAKAKEKKDMALRFKMYRNENDLDSWTHPRVGR